MFEESDKNCISRDLEVKQLLEQVKIQVDDFLKNSVQSCKKELHLENTELRAEINRLKKFYEQQENKSISTEPASSHITETSDENPKKKSNLKIAKIEELIEHVDVSRLDFRVGHIISVEKHPDADSLYVEKINVGELKPRTVVSGLVKHMSSKELENQLVVVLCNLKPAKMRGVTSEAMVMCASTPEKVELLVPPTGSLPGELIEFEGYKRNADAILNPKKKIFESCAPDLKTDNDCVATYKSVPFVVPEKGKVVARTLSNVQIK